ncbi:MAG: hypothetical protein IPK46_22315 [Saprospiraceae bacterium]|nr:hypothetical protein [Saprospiraceae bacterium]
MKIKKGSFTSLFILVFTFSYRSRSALHFAILFNGGRFSGCGITPWPGVGGFGSGHSIVSYFGRMPCFDRYRCGAMRSVDRAGMDGSVRVYYSIVSVKPYMKRMKYPPSKGSPRPPTNWVNPPAEGTHPWAINRSINKSD